MIVSGEKMSELDLSSKKSDTPLEEGLFYYASKIPAGNSIKILFHGGLDGIMSFVEHRWSPENLYNSNSTEHPVTKHVRFNSLRTNWYSPVTECPGFILGSEGKITSRAVVLIDNGTEVKEHIFEFSQKSIREGILSVYRNLKADYGDDEDINNKWIRINNSGEGAARYSVSFSSPFKGKVPEPKHDVMDYIQTLPFNEIVLQMSLAGLPILERLTELGLDENGVKIVEKTVTPELETAVAE